MSDIEQCVWQQNEDGYYDTSCKGSFVLNDGTPLENYMRFCCYCGDILKQKLYEGKEDE